MLHSKKAVRTAATYRMVHLRCTAKAFCQGRTPVPYGLTKAVQALAQLVYLRTKAA